MCKPNMAFQPQLGPVTPKKREILHENTTFERPLKSNSEISVALT